MKQPDTTKMGGIGIRPRPTEPFSRDYMASSENGRLLVVQANRAARRWRVPCGLPHLCRGSTERRIDTPRHAASAALHHNQKPSTKVGQVQ
jgi:hypothetical protein